MNNGESAETRRSGRAETGWITLRSKEAKVRTLLLCFFVFLFCCWVGLRCGNTGVYSNVMTSLTLDPRKTALVLIDLQQGVVSRPCAPHPAVKVVANAARLADRFRELGATVVLVHVTFHPDFKDALNPPADAAAPFNPSALPPTWADLMPELGPQPGDLVITKRQWGAFHGTELDLQLRRRDVRTIVLGGISTNIGVESTARSAYEHGYAQILVEDAMASSSVEMHEFTVKNIFPRIGHVRSTDQVLAALAP
jgi:nicotinamidase-related amidase